MKETVPVRKARIEAERLDEIGDEIEERVSERAAIQGEPQSNRFEQVSEDRYRLVLTALGITFEIDRLRRDHNELIGELAVRCALAGARTYDGNLSIADFNLSSARARADRAKLLAGRAQVEGLDWTGFLEELCQRVLAAEQPHEGRRGVLQHPVGVLEREPFTILATFCLAASMGGVENMHPLTPLLRVELLDVARKRLVIGSAVWNGYCPPCRPG